MQRQEWVIFLCILALSLDQFIASCGFQKYHNRFNQKIYLRKNPAVTAAYFCYGLTFLKREKIFH